MIGSYDFGVTRRLAAVLLVFLLGGCANYQVKPDDPAYAPVQPGAFQPMPPQNGSIYRAGYDMRLFEDVKARRLGDILTIRLVEKTDAKTKADTDLNKEGSVLVAVPTLLGQPLNVDGDNLFDLDTQRASTGEAESKQSNSLKGDITVTVVEVQSNGNLRVRGEKWIYLNQGEEYIRIIGLVRPEDIAADNSVLSTRVADARISYGGTGPVADTNAAGWLARFFLSPFWPL